MDWSSTRAPGATGPMAAGGGPAAPEAGPAAAELVSAFSLAIDLAEGRQFNHARRTAGIAVGLWEALGLPEEGRGDVFYAGLLHDAGAINLLWPLAHLKPDSSSERELIRQHPLKSAEIARTLRFTGRAAEIITGHHEFWDGSGYPLGRCGEENPLESRILCLADRLDVAYGSGAARDFPALLEYARRHAGTLFDPQLVDAFARMADRAFEFAGATGRPSDEAVPGRHLEKLVPAQGTSVDEVVRALAGLIDAKSPYTAAHSTNVARLSWMVGERFGLSGDRLEKIRTAGWLHDIGKVAIPGAIIDKPGKLDLDEMNLMRRHSLYSGQILEQINAFVPEVAPWARSHHERLDGTGYPSGLGAADLPLEARILSAADMFDALTSDRSYRKGMPTEEALDVMWRCCEGTFGREVFEAVRECAPRFLADRQ